MLAALRVPDQGIAATDIDQHAARDLTGVGAGRVSTEVLGTELQGIAAKFPNEHRQMHKRRQHHHIARRSRVRGHRLRECISTDAVAMHLPVTSHQLAAHTVTFVRHVQA